MSVDDKKYEKYLDEIIEKNKKILEIRENRIIQNEIELMTIEDIASSNLENRTKNTNKLLKLENDKKVFIYFYYIGRKSI